MTALFFISIGKKNEKNNNDTQGSTLIIVLYRCTDTYPLKNNRKIGTYADIYNGMEMFGNPKCLEQKEKQT